MSAPRKITTARRIGSGRRDILTAETTMSMGYVDANTYHHDDVVRELVEALKECADDLAEWIAISDSLKRAGFNMDDTGQRLDRARAALANIAQEG